MVECADSRHATLCDADSRGFIVVAFCSAILHHWMCKIPTEVATLTADCHISVEPYLLQYSWVLQIGKIKIEKIFKPFCNKI
ncbi:hypothetical protein PsalMR5_01344 [Piscirickettsia salmonis]|nr:hypothetical protein PsalSR1_01333 [Piscirickettsia salmonis]QGP60192.1 hypothetical protein PsalBI1_02797 [Piscirickettsia salmonis]QGP63487.1 hypothetical protein PsalMR5_01344 [Piscirickettsia salmonis]